jgi:hypothetical protein
MTAAIDVYLSAARENSTAAAALADALTANGVNCFSGASDSPPAETLAALESGRALVFVLSSASNASPDVVRELERAAGRGIPIITYAIEDVSPSPSIAYFTETIPPIQAWSGEDRERTIHNVVEATRRALSEPASSTKRTGLSRAHYAKATYRDGKGLQIGVAAALAISACLNAYMLYRDASFLVTPLLGRQGQPVATAADFLGSTTLASTFGNWSVIVGTILMLRRARLNQLSFFANVRTGGGEIVWRPLVPFANALWLPRMATDLRDSGDSDDARVNNWSLARYWGVAFSCAYSITGFRDGVLNIVPQSVGLLVGMSAVVDAFHIVTAFLTYAVLSQVLDRVRARQRSRQTPQASSGPAVSDLRHASGEVSPIDPDVLIAFASEDETIAGLVAKGLEEFRCRCWTTDPSTNGATLSPHHLAGFDAILVVVSRASHSSASIAELVRCALAVSAPVLPFVVDAPPTGSALGHYIRSLHWIDGAAGSAGLRSQRVRTAFSTNRAHAAGTGGPAAAVDSGLFSRLYGAAVGEDRYRPAGRVRATATAMAIGQVAAASIVGFIAFAIALTPENAEPLTAFGISMVLVLASCPAWIAFFFWLRIADRNARRLQMPGLESRAWLLWQAAVPGLGLVMGGRAIARLRRSISDPDDKGRGWSDPATRLRITWTSTGVAWTLSFLAAWELGARGWIVTSMFASVVQCVVTCVRGVQRVRLIRDVGSRLDARARLWFTA